jgi:YfiH family protein
MQIDFPCVPAVWSESQAKAIGFTTINQGLSGGAGTMAAVDPAGARNREALGKALVRANHGQSVAIQWVQQTHGIANFYASVASTQQLPIADAVWTDQPGIALAIQTADCVPVLFVHRQGALVAAAHAGWRGLLGGVIETLVTSLPVQPADLQAWIGPCIGIGHFEVGPDVWAVVQDQCPEAVLVHARDPAKRMVDLVRLTQWCLQSCGVVLSAAVQRCTYADAAFYSHRRVTVENGVGAKTGRMASVVMLQDR